jgi:hypothetical protein
VEQLLSEATRFLNGVSLIDGRSKPFPASAIGLRGGSAVTASCRRKPNEGFTETHRYPARHPQRGVAAR